MIKYMTSSFEFHHTLLETMTADFVQNGSLDGFGSLEYHVEDASSELTSDVLKYLSDLVLASRELEVITSHTEVGEFFWEE